MDKIDHFGRFGPMALKYPVPMGDQGFRSVMPDPRVEKLVQTVIVKDDRARVFLDTLVSPCVKIVVVSDVENREVCVIQGFPV